MKIAATADFNVSCKKYFWPLMKNTITEQDKQQMIEFIKNTDRFTNGPMVKQFEKVWSDWLGIKYSLYVSNGSTANFLLVAAIKEKNNLKDGDKVLVPSMTWATNIGPIIQLGLEPIFCDVDPNNFCFDIKHMEYLSKKHDDIKLVFVSHLFGISGEMNEYKKIFPNSIFIEDVCESHGATYKGKKTGTLSSGGTFSFYFGHHMTTIEGGFVCTDDHYLYELMKAKRSHGLAREMSSDYFASAKQKYPNVHPDFLFITDGYNFRNTEINAVLGLSQIKRLDSNNQTRINNFNRFLKIISKHERLSSEFKTEGISPYCMIFRCDSKALRQSLESYLRNNGVETRPLCGGNLLNQPFLKNYQLDIPWDSNIEKLDTNGFFIGNNHMITEENFSTLEYLLEKFFINNR
jgi:CDP-6-deoxy-D-xylo-4-hexulose-3-dehydrase